MKAALLAALLVLGCNDDDWQEVADRKIAAARARELEAREECEATPGCTWIGTLGRGESVAVELEVPIDVLPALEPDSTITGTADTWKINLGEATNLVADLSCNVSALLAAARAHASEGDPPPLPEAFFCPAVVGAKCPPPVGCEVYNVESERLRCLADEAGQREKVRADLILVIDACEKALSP